MSRFPAPDEVTQYLHRHIPLSKALGARVAQVDDRLVVEAPLDANLNHQETAFGGSVAAIAILAGWSWMHTRAKAEGFEGRIVIQRSDVEYRHPIEAPFRAVCEGVTDRAWERFLRTLGRFDRARLKLDCSIESEGRVAGNFTGDFVALSEGSLTR